jgi:hypothetical protein
MENVEIKVTGDKLVITCDLTARGVTSKTGKTKLIASTHGIVPVECKRPGVKLALNVMVPNNGH